MFGFLIVSFRKTRNVCCEELVGQISTACEVTGKGNGRVQNRDRPDWAGVFQAQLINSTYARGLRCGGGSWCLCLTCSGLHSLCPYLLSRKLLHSPAVLPSSLQHQPWLFATFLVILSPFTAAPASPASHCQPARGHLVQHQASTGGFQLSPWLHMQRGCSEKLCAAWRDQLSANRHD